MMGEVNIDELSGVDLRAYAAELGIRTDGRWGDDRVREAIRAHDPAAAPSTDDSDDSDKDDESDDESNDTEGDEDDSDEDEEPVEEPPAPPRRKRPRPERGLVIRSTAGPVELRVPGHPGFVVPGKGHLRVTREQLEAIGEHLPCRPYFESKRLVVDEE